MSILCTGSVAVDHIMVYRGRFKDVILPDKVHVLNVAFHVPELRRSFGGCAANIAYNLRLLGEDPIVLATVGADDFAAYAAWLDQHRIRRDHIVPLAGEATAGCYITTDLDDNQITGFHPGAMDRAHEAPVARVAERITLGLVSPNGKRAMREHARALKARGVPTVVDPGQGLPLFSGDELVELLDGASVYVANDYEWSLTLSSTGLSEDAIAARVGAVIVTRGEAGSTLREGSRTRAIPPVPARSLVDPTGCGDAYRAGLAHGMRRGLPLEKCARMGSLMGSLLVERHGTQSLSLAPGEFAERYRAAFGEELG
jgi:adenosine kinase